MKYIDAERLNTEIERLYNGEAPKHDQQCDFDDGYFVGIDAISQLIDSLQQEQPEVDLEKASRNVYESWMGGTMDDVRRDMVELGRVLNARKEENR
jgi:hypothetical protein